VFFRDGQVLVVILRLTEHIVDDFVEKEISASCSECLCNSIRRDFGQVAAMRKLGPYRFGDRRPTPRFVSTDTKPIKAVRHLKVHITWNLLLSAKSKDIIMEPRNVSICGLSIETARRWARRNRNRDNAG